MAALPGPITYPVDRQHQLHQIPSGSACAATADGAVRLADARSRRIGSGELRAV